MPFVILPTNSASGGYDITNSARFNIGSSDYLEKTLSGTSTNRKLCTFSYWVKRSDISDTKQGCIGGFLTSSSGQNLQIGFYDNGFYAVYYDGSIIRLNLVSSALARDVSAWYHVVVAIDTTQATTSNRTKMYVNGVQVTSFTTSDYPVQNVDFPMTNGFTTHIGKYTFIGSTTEYFSGYMSDVFFIDGQQLTPTSFGETDEDTGIWKPKAYTGTYGTNGFYLQFKNSASLGTDSSGNGNTFTVNNLTSVDQSTDTPTNNFTTWNPLWFSGTTVPNTSFTEGNLTVQTTTTAGANSEIQGTMGVNKGKWYYEFKMTSTGTGSGLAVGFANNNYTDALTYYSDNGKYYTESTSVTYGATWTTGDIIGVALDCDNNTMTFYKNGTSQGVITSVFSNLSTDFYLPIMWDGSGSLYANASVNFGSPPYSANSYTDGAGKGNFSYSVPSGYFALCTANLSLYG